MALDGDRVVALQTRINLNNIGYLGRPTWQAGRIYIIDLNDESVSYWLPIDARADPTNLSADGVASTWIKGSAAGCSTAMSMVTERPAGCRTTDMW